jgi:hypothetical protein
MKDDSRKAVPLPGDIEEILDRAYEAMGDSGSNDAEHDSLVELTELVADLADYVHEPHDGKTLIAGVLYDNEDGYEAEEPTVTVEGTAYHVLANGDAICPECGATRSPARIADHMASEHGDEDDDDAVVYDDNDMENPYPRDREDGEGLGLSRPSYGD